MCRERLGDERDRQYDIAAMKEANALSEENVTSQLEILNKRIAVISQRMRNETIQLQEVSSLCLFHTQTMTESNQQTQMLQGARFEFDSSLNTSIARAITVSVPLIPKQTSMRDILEDITLHKQVQREESDNRSIHNFLIRKQSSIELITSQSVFNYIASGNNIDAVPKDNLITTRIPFVSRAFSIRKAFKLMTDRVGVVPPFHPRTFPWF